MTVIKTWTQPARLSFVISLVSVVALILLLVTQDTAHRNVSAPPAGVDLAENHNNAARGVW